MRTVFAALLSLAAFAGPAAPASAQEPPPFLIEFPGDPASGSTGGKLDEPRGIATDPVSGHVFVSEASNARVSEFTAWGQFVKAFGWGVVASGPGDEPQNEVQEIAVDATAGDLTLRLYRPFIEGSCARQQVTSPIAFDASAAQLRTALEGLCSVASGDLEVSGAGPEGGAPWTVEFGGGLADADVLPLQVASSTLSGGAGASVATLQGGASFEVCVPADGDVCRVGQGLAFGEGGGAAAGQLTGPEGVAVDSAGNVYVADRRPEGEKSYRVQKFDPEGEFVSMLGGEVNKTTGEDVCTAADLAAEDACGVGVPGEAAGEFEWSPQFAEAAEGDYVDVGPDGVLYVGDLGRVQRFDLGGAHEVDLPLPEARNTKSLAVDPVSGDVYVVLGQRFSDFAPEVPVVFRLDPESGAVEDELPVGDPEAEPFAVRGFAEHLAVDSGGSVYAASLQKQTDSGAWQAILQFDPSGACVLCPGDRPGFAERQDLGAPQIGGLATGVACAPVSDDVYVTSFEQGQSYVTVYGPPPQDIEKCPPPPPEPAVIAEQYALSVGAEGAVVRGAIDPRFALDARYHVEYGTAPCSEGGCGVAPGLPGPLLTEKVANIPVATKGIVLPGLAPGTTYHYRLVAESSGGGPIRGVGGTPAEDGEEGMFTTYPLPTDPRTDCPNQRHRTGAGALLPECRAHELVSPVDKNGGQVVTQTAGGSGYPARLQRAAVDGDGLTYSSEAAFADAVGAPFSSQYLARRRAGDRWSTKAISPPREEGNIGESIIVKFNTDFRDFSDDLCSAWLIPNTDPPLAEGALAGHQNLYRRDNCGSAAGEYDAYTTEEPPVVDPDKYWPELQGRSADGSHVVFRANGRLTPEASGATVAGEPIYQLYESVSGELRLVSVLPNGTASDLPATAGTANDMLPQGRAQSVANAVSRDGSRIFWTAAAQGPGPLYVRLDGTETKTISGSPARFWAAATDGSTAIYSVGGELRAYDVEAGKSSLIAEGVQGVAGASEDASRVYFASAEVLTEDPNGEGDVAVEGERNLYLYDAGAEGGQFAFIGTDRAVSTIDVTSTAPKPAQRPARISPDGSHFAFMSIASLTGYDNTDAASGEADAEVFLYDAEADELACVSCNPSGARPRGRDIREYVRLNIDPFWAAARLPAWETQLYSPRALSADGSRLYFESFDALVLRDTNGKADVYEWRESSGESECEAIGADLWVEGSGGCLSLISSGESLQDSEFVDASKGGRDVFFKTAESLLPQDPGLIDVYDARRGGGLPVPTGPEPGCQGEACQSPEAAPAPPTPASQAFQGPGNEPAPSPCGRAARRAKRLAVGAKRMRRAARRVARRSRATRRSSPPRQSKRIRKAKRMRRGAAKRAKRARRASKAARRCRARVVITSVRSPAVR